MSRFLCVICLSRLLPPHKLTNSLTLLELEPLLLPLRCRPNRQRSLLASPSRPPPPPPHTLSEFLSAIMASSTVSAPDIVDDFSILLGRRLLPAPTTSTSRRTLQTKTQMQLNFPLAMMTLMKMKSVAPPPTPIRVVAFSATTSAF